MSENKGFEEIKDSKAHLESEALENSMEAKGNEEATAIKADVDTNAYVKAQEIATILTSEVSVLKQEQAVKKEKMVLL